MHGAGPNYPLREGGNYVSTIKLLLIVAIITMIILIIASMALIWQRSLCLNPGQCGHAQRWHFQEVFGRVGSGPFCDEVLPHRRDHDHEHDHDILRAIYFVLPLLGDMAEKVYGESI